MNLKNIRKTVRENNQGQFVMYAEVKPRDYLVYLTNLSLRHSIDKSYIERS